MPSAPMVIKDDPTLMFTNAGMNQFKNVILGNDPVRYPRVADAQKCLRVSGKHNDLEEVGHDTYHHTMFEMLGNWSFGDYFKREAIAWAWEYLTEVLRIDGSRLYATVFEGSPTEGLARDKEAADIWAQYLPETHIIDGSRKDNFWEMGDTGPCGPCSEIHIDLRCDSERENIPGHELVNKNHPLVTEIWNNVFMQYNRKADGSLEDLPAKVIDTGMGFERLCMVMQGKTSSYDTDVFQPIIREIGRMSGVSYGAGEKSDVAMRVVADHLRTIAFSITDGQLPSNVKAGYVIRRILRRAVRYGYTFLGRREAFIYRLVPALIKVMGSAYPELAAQQNLIEKVTKEEEEAFLRTLETGIRLLDRVMDDVRKEGRNAIAGKDAFTLYDTYGFPLDLTELILRENGFEVELEGFNAEMKKQRERARNAAAVEADDWVVVREGESEFVGYDLTSCETQLLRYRKIKQKNKEYYQLVLSLTPFYAEMGGQVGDSGRLSSQEGESIHIIDTKKENNLSVHLSHRLPADLTATFVAEVDTDSRRATSCNHSATHLLHEALREVLGKHVEQKGSFVGPLSLRFDFSHFQKVSKEELRQVERLVNARIRANLPLQEMRSVSMAEARQMGAMALFGEKYGESVRVIRFGTSVELCGGTHVPATGQIGMLHIVNEASIAAGVRRIEAITAAKAEEYFLLQQDMLDSIRDLFHNTPSLLTAIQKTIDENAGLKKQVDDFVHEKITLLRDKLLENAREINGVKVVRIELEATPEMVRTLAFQLRNASPENLFFVAGAVNNGKPSLAVLVSEDLVERGLDAVRIVREAAKEIQGGGGGQPTFAAAGGKNADGLKQAIEKALQALEV